MVHSVESGIQTTTVLGKYLSMPILQKRVNKETFGEILERVNSKLAGWKGKCLSLAGRLTLTKSVLASIPIHTMCVITMPKALLDDLDKVARSFLWGSTSEKRKQHLISWKRVCTPKQEGGLGIKRAQDMNKALLAKLGWRLLTDHQSLWARILRRKYKVGDTHNIAWTVPKSTWSSTWRSVGLGIREVVLQGQSWVLGDGRDILFWKDRWLTNEPIIDSAVDVVPADRVNDCVSDLWWDGRGWELGRFLPYNTENTRLRLGALVVDKITGTRDHLSWGLTVDGAFTVKSAYSLLTRSGELRPNMEKFWSCVWSCMVPERRIVPPSKVHQFFTMSLLEWLYANLSVEVRMEHFLWSTIFGMALWWGWKWRCGNLFGVNGKCRDRVGFIKKLAKEVNDANVLGRGGQGPRVRVERMVKWEPPRSGWLKLNTDGASRGNPGRASAGGVLRDALGEWRGGFALNIGICSAPLAELWGVYYGLYIAWQKRVTNLELAVDSKVVVGFLKTGVSATYPLSFLVRLCHGYISKDWNVHIYHTYREANRLADGLATMLFLYS
ncbi:Ribonuclease H domain [Arabidopsis thaliana x Arabidopsis arenosa]|uniref:Ribonuclease H domain n=1 Tax=Arabidopsis thaliana x Arabidopsis arenosa TaxID=1240361 RepID=A0A8T2DYD4_9BRAS|nr:Ribonuclease H domain [Arabidopsis thaliana x Arabidopsis arenosa]